jgi:hypothetical protein
MEQSPKEEKAASAPSANSPLSTKKQRANNSKEKNHEIKGDDPNALTVLTACSGRLNKIVKKDGTVVGYDQAKFFSGRAVSVGTKRELVALLNYLNGQAESAIVHNAIVDGTNQQHMRRLFHDQEDGDKATLWDAPRTVHALDIESVLPPYGLDLHDLKAAAQCVRDALPDELRRVGYVAVASSSYLLKPGLRFHFWVRTDKPLTCKQFKQWLEHLKAPVDVAPLNGAGITYTACPIFEDQNADPLPDRRLVVLKGHACVTVPDYVFVLIDRGRDEDINPEIDSSNVGDRERNHAAIKLLMVIEELKNTDDKRNIKLNSVAFYMGRMVGAGWIDYEEVRDALLEATTLDNDLEARLVVRRAIRDGMRQPRKSIEESVNPYELFNTQTGELIVPDDSGEEKPYFERVNEAALANIMAWAPKLFPEGEAQESGAWLVSSKGISIHSDGAPPIDLVREHYEDNKDAVSAARWLCEHLGVTPASLGWGKPRGNGKQAIIQVQGGHLSMNATLCEEALSQSKFSMFQRSQRLVRPIVEEVEAAHGRRTKVPQLIQITTPYLRDVLCRNACFIKFDGRSKKWVQVDPPIDLPNTILSRIGEWAVPVVAGVISTPTLRPDGTILDREGYDDATRLLLAAPPPMPPIPDKPTREDALAALALLKGLLKEFIFVDDVSRAVALSALITPVVRGAFNVAPMHCAKAPVAGSGKSYLFDVVAAIAIGHSMPVMAAGRNEEETEKRIGAALMVGQPLICIDNVNGELGGDALCQVIERPIVDIRILGKSEKVRVEGRGATFFCTGNNIVLVGDLCRRVLTTVLDPQMERPELREFKGDPVAAVLAERGRYIAAALTICRAYIVAGQPERRSRLASFGGWSDTVRSALTWLGEADPVDSLERARSEDPVIGELREMLFAWSETLGLGRTYQFTVAEVFEAIDERVYTSGGLASPWPRLNSAIQTVAGRRGKADALRLGYWLRSYKGRIVDGLRFNTGEASKSNKSKQWWAEDSRTNKQEKGPFGKREKPSDLNELTPMVGRKVGA